MDALRNDAGNRMLTDNSSPAYKSTLDPALDLFSTAANANGTGTSIAPPHRFSNPSEP